VRRTASLSAVVVALATVTLFADNWPQWRGPELNGVSRERGLATTWNQTEHVAWKLAMPSRSGSTPIVWNDTIFLNVAMHPSDGELELWSVDRGSGAIAWKRTVGGGNHIERKQNMSSPSPVTDGAAVWVMTGTGILKAFDFKGSELWVRDIQKDYGRFGLQWGYASSPLLYEDALFVQVLHGMRTDDPSYLLRLDKKTGRTVWRVERPTQARQESPDAYTTPILIRSGAANELVITGGDVVTGHDPATGKELWRVHGLNPENRGDYRIVASPLVAGALLIAPTRESPMLAIRPGGRGDVTRSHVEWSFTRGGPDVPTPVSDGQYVYVVNDRGLVHCLDVKTGATVYGPQRLKPGTYSASPVLADGHIYVTSEDGVTSVFAAGPTFKLVAENAVDEYTLSSIAVSNGQIFLRAEKHLYAIGQPAAPGRTRR
jgi:outer membrane protein assembly factor BamB